MYSAYTPSSAHSKRPSTSSDASFDGSTATGSRWTGATPSSRQAYTTPAAVEYTDLIDRQRGADAARRENMQAKLQAMQRTQEEESASLEQSHVVQFEHFVVNSDKMLAEIRERCQAAENALLAKHADERVAWENAAGIENMKPKPARDVMEVRKKEERCVQKKDWTGAEKFRMIAEELEVHELHQQAGTWFMKQELERAKMMQRQAKELRALQLKNSTTTSEAVLRQEKELEKMQKRMATAKLALTRQHAKERQMLEQSFKGNNTHQRTSLALQSKQAQTLGPYMTPSSSNPGSARGSGYRDSPGAPSNTVHDQAKRPMTTGGIRRSQQYGGQYQGSPGAAYQNAGSSNLATPRASYGKQARQHDSRDYGHPQSRKNPRDLSSPGHGPPVYLTDDIEEALPGVGALSPRQLQKQQLGYQGEERMPSGNGSSSPRLHNPPPISEDHRTASDPPLRAGGGLPHRRPRVSSGSSLQSSSARSSDGGWIGPRAQGMDKSVMPKGVYERMQAKKAADALADHSRKMTAYARKFSAPALLTKEALAKIHAAAHAHDKDEEGLSEGDEEGLGHEEGDRHHRPRHPEMQASVPYHDAIHHGAYHRKDHRPITPSELASDKAYAGSSIRPATATAVPMY